MTESPVRLLFPARLIADKGVDVVLDAVQEAEGILLKGDPETATQIVLSIMGTGPLLGMCKEFSENHRGRIRVGVHEPVQYGDRFFAVIRRHHAVLLANRQLEQPRIVYDAFSQGVPVITSDTKGVSGIVYDGTNGLVFPMNDGAGLAKAIIRFCSDLSLRRHLSKKALASAEGFSHLEMHQVRERFLKETFQL